MYYQLILTGTNDNDCRNEVVNALIAAAKLDATEAYYAIDNPPYVISNRDTLQEAKELKDNIERSGAIIEIVEFNDTYKVHVTGYDSSSKVKVIGKIREVLGIDLVEAKNIVDNLPTVIATGLTIKEAENIVNKLNEAQVTSIIEGIKR